MVCIIARLKLPIPHAMPGYIGLKNHQCFYDISKANQISGYDTMQSLDCPQLVRESAYTTLLVLACISIGVSCVFCSATQIFEQGVGWGGGGEVSREESPILSLLGDLT